MTVSTFMHPNQQSIVYSMITYFEHKVLPATAIFTADKNGPRFWRSGG